jgi:hypothetical protein
MANDTGSNYWFMPGTGTPETDAVTPAPQTNTASEQLSSSSTTIMDPNTGLPVEVVLNPDFVEPRYIPDRPRFGLPPVPPGMLGPVFDYDQWKYVDLYILKPPTPDSGNTPSPISGGVTGAGTPPTTIKLEDGTVVTSGGTGLVGFPGRLPIVLPGSSVTSTPILDLSQPPVAPVTPVTPPKPPKPITLPGSSVTSTPSIVEPTTVPIPARRMQEALNPYNGYINYDPDEILAAAMRVMNGRMAGRSMLNDLRR